MSLQFTTDDVQRGIEYVRSSSRTPVTYSQLFDYVFGINVSTISREEVRRYMFAFHNLQQEPWDAFVVQRDSGVPGFGYFDVNGFPQLKDDPVQAAQLWQQQRDQCR